MHHRRQPEAGRIDDDAPERRHEGAEETDAADEIATGPGHRPADIGQEIDDRRARRLRWLAHVPIGDFLQQDLLGLAQAREFRLGARRAKLGPGPVQDPGAQRVEPVDTGQVQHGARRRPGSPRERRCAGLDGVCLIRGPASREPEA